MKVGLQLVKLVIIKAIALTLPSVKGSKTISHQKYTQRSPIGKFKIPHQFIVDDERNFSTFLVFFLGASLGIWVLNDIFGFFVDFSYIVFGY